MTNASTARLDQVSAGAFCEWLAQARAALLGDGGSNVPCGDCVGCCVSSYYVPIRSHETHALEAVPREFLVDVPGAPRGDFMLGYSAEGRCPMLTKTGCSIYHARPQTCRDYDCRIFAAAGIDAGGAEKAAINKRVREWRFSYPTSDDERAHDAVLAAAAFIGEQRNAFPGSRAPTAPTGIAVLAIKVYAVFLDSKAATLTDSEIARAIIDASGRFDAMTPANCF